MVDSRRYVAAHPPTSSLESKDNGTDDGWRSQIFSGTNARQSSFRPLRLPPGRPASFANSEDWGEYAAGSYAAASEVPAVPKNVRFHVGSFADALPGCVASLSTGGEITRAVRRRRLRFARGGTVDMLKYLAPRIGPGTVIIFDEYPMNSTWREDEQRAWKEACEEFGWEYEYLSFSLFSKQVAVRVTESDSFVGPLPR